ncbi:MAG: radical SAM family heme chaperone HemW [Bacteroidetes Order II. Incertae sedis bacterium]|nr:radical SAM family heme chaperone HemW [Bacteroidetes Order II. bacterium]
MATLYYHVPFCARRCIYCDFYFVTTNRLFEPFADALILEIEHQGRKYGKKEPINTLYFGGGTPSLMPLAQLVRILEATAQWFDLSAVSETTIEVNPDDLNLPYLQGLRDIGFDRLSIGIQSFHEADLQFLGRAHNQKQAYESLYLARKAGFDNFSIDLIYGLPHQSLADWEHNLETATKQEVPHISAYSLTVEAGTVLNKKVEKGQVIPTDEGDMGNLFGFTAGYLTRMKYEHYEISNYARPGFRSQHNQRYWTHENYIGFGPSAHSFWWDHPPSAYIHRWANVRNLQQYQNQLLQKYALPIAEHDRLTAQEVINEYVMLRLRTDDGLDLSHLEQHYGYDLLMEKLDEIAWLEAESFIYPVKKHRLRLTLKGKLVCDALTQRLLKN